MRISVMLVVYVVLQFGTDWASVVAALLGRVIKSDLFPDVSMPLP